MKSRRSAFTLCALAAAGLSLGVIACGDGEAGGASAKGQDGTKVVTFWSSNVLTGQSAFFGKGSVQEQQLLKEKINDAGGFTDNCGNKYTIELKVWDDADTPAQSVSGMQKAAADKDVLAVIGSTSDVGWLPSLPVAGQLKIPLIIPSDGSSVPADKWNEYAFRIKGAASATFNLAIDTLIKHTDLSRVAVLYDITQDSQTADANLWKEYADKKGYEIVAFESFRNGDTDFRSQLTKMKAASPDFLVFDGSEPSGIYNQAKELGLIPAIPAYSAYGINNSVEQWKLTHGAVKNSFDYASSAIGENIEMNDRDALTLYEEKTGAPPNTDQAAGWDGLNVAVDAVKRSCTNTDREKFRDALADTKDFPLAAQGSLTWKNPPTGENITPHAEVTKVIGPGKSQVLK